MTLSWSTPDDNGSTITRYEYQQTTPPTNLWIPITGSHRNTVNHTVTGLKNGTAYQFQVRAINSMGPNTGTHPSSGGTRDPNNNNAVVPGTVTPTTKPAPPRGLEARPSNSKVALHWATATADTAADGFSAISSYELRQKAGDEDYSPWTTIIGSGATTGSNGSDGTFGTADDVAAHTVTGLTNGTTYQFEVRARNTNGAGPASATQPVTIASTPGRPRSLTAVPGNRQVALSWTASSNGGSPITSWQFRLALAAGSFTNDNPSTPAVNEADPAWITIPGSNADTTSYTVVSLDNEAEYKFQVRAVNALGAGSIAESAVVNPGMAPGAPTVLSGEASDSSVTITWMPPLNAADSSLNDGGAPIIRYEYSQKADDGEYGEWTAVASDALFTTTDTSLTATSTAAQRALTTTAVDLTDNTDDVDGMGTEVKGLTAGTAYLFRVRAVNATGAGQPATMARPAYPGTKPPAPASLNARAVYDAPSGGAQIALSWASGGDGGSPITSWEYVYASSLSDLSSRANNAANWVDICSTSPTSSVFDPNCASSTSVSVPRARTAAGTLPDGSLTFVDRTTSPAAPALSTAEHHFIIRAVNDRGTGFTSGIDSASFVTTVPSAPPAVYIDSTTGSSIILTWAPSVDGGSTILRYEYSVRVGDGSWGTWVRGTTSATATYTVPPGTPPGTPHTFRVRAVNQQGRGVGSHTESATVAAGAPGTPGADNLGTTATFGTRTINAPSLVAQPGRTQVTLILVGTTGSAVATTRWEYSYKVGDGEYGNWTFNINANNFNNANGSGGGGLVIDGLQNGVPHTFRIRALNGPLSSPILESNPAIPGVTPPAPQGLTAQAGDRSVTLSWTSGGSGGPPITKWQYCGGESVDVSTDGSGSGTTKCGTATGSPSAGWNDVPKSGADTTEYTIGTTPGTELTNGARHTYLVRAVNVIGAGARAQANPATPGKAPNAPARVVADPGNGQVTITVDAPIANPLDPGRTVTGYQVRKSMNGGAYDAWESLGTSSPAPLTAESPGVAITGLVNGASYTFQVRAVNAFGPGAETDSNPATPVGAPTAGELGADPGDGQVTLSWAPGSSGGSAVTKWQYRQSESGGGYGVWTDIDGSDASTSSHTVTGLSNGTAYTFQVRAVSAVSTSVPITSGAATPGTIPAAPSVSAAGGNGQVDLSWTAGTAAGAGPTTGWQVRTDDGSWMDVDGADTSSYTVTGLSNGTAYTFEVRAVNAFGAGPAGGDSATPATTPSAPDVSAMRGDGSTTVSWTAGDNGGSAVTGWHLQVNGGEWVNLATYGLGADPAPLPIPTDDGTAYTFGVRGVNDVGEGAAGTASVEAGSVPAAPTVTASGSNGSITVSWTAGDDGGSSITGWHYRMKVSISDYGDWVETDDTSVTLSDLDSGTGVLSYTFQVRAVNGVGAGDAGTSNAATPVDDPAVNGMYYSGVVTGPNFCADLSLGGARLFAFDSDGDGVADTCALPFTKREAIARQNAVATLASQHAAAYVALVNAACATVEGDAACGGDTLASPGVPPINDGGPYYSGTITGPSYCANMSLGGPVTYPFDSDGDGVADTCAYPYTTREAIARQLAGDVLAALNADDFKAILQDECRRLGGADYGDDPAHLAEDACA